METRITNQKIQEVADKIVKEYQPEKIILFGSYAWGKPHKDSDVDLFIIKETDNVRETSRKMSRSIFPRPFPLDIIVYSPEDFKKRLEMEDAFIIDIFNNGKYLYGAN